MSDPAAPPTERKTLGHIASRPLLAVAIALIVGICLYAQLPQFEWLWIGSSLALVLMAAVAWSRAIVASALILSAIVMLGVALAQLHQYRYPPNDISAFTTETRRLAELELRIVDEPRIFAPNFGQAYPLPPKQTTIAEVLAVRTWSGVASASGRVLVQIAEPNPSLAAGQRVRVLGMLDRPAPAMNPGQFDWATYYRRQRVLASFQVPHAGNIQILEQQSPGMLQHWRRATRDWLAEGFGDSQSLDHALLRALVLGDSDPELRDVQEQFRASGTSHHLAISGMHVAVVGSVVFLLARLFRLSPRWAWWLAIGFVLAYGLAALPSAPVVRSILLWIVVGIAIVSRRAIDLLQLLALVVIAMLVYQPLDVLNPGFQLSFGIVLGLIVLTRPMSRLMGGTHEPETDEPVDRWIIRAAAYVDSQIVLVAAAGLVAWLVSLPIVAANFSQLNPWAIFASIILAPVVFLALIGGVLKIILTALWPSAAGTWAELAQYPIAWMRHMVEWLASLPGGDVPMPAPPAWTIVLFYASMLIAAINWPRPGMRLLGRLAHLASIAILLILPFHSQITQDNPAGELRVTVLAVGAGQCAVIEPPSGRTLVIDAGSLSLSDPLRRAIAPYLRFRGITSIDTVAISHANTDHFSAVAELVEAYGVREVLTAPGFAQSASGNPMATEMLALLVRADRPPRSVLPGQIIPMGSDTQIEVVWPPENADLPANDESLVIRLTHAGTRILFTGDIQEAALAKLIETPDRIRAEILIAPHHGSSESNTPAFLAAVAPRCVISSNDRTLTGKQTRFAQMAGTLPLLRTHDRGAITMQIRRDEFDVTPFVGSSKDRVTIRK